MGVSVSALPGAAEEAREAPRAPPLPPVRAAQSPSTPCTRPLHTRSARPSALHVPFSSFLTTLSHSVHVLSPAGHLLGRPGWSTRKGNAPPSQGEQVSTPATGQNHGRAFVLTCASAGTCVHALPSRPPCRSLMWSALPVRLWLRASHLMLSDRGRFPPELTGQGDSPAPRAGHQDLHITSFASQK